MPILLGARDEVNKEWHMWKASARKRLSGCGAYQVINTRKYDIEKRPLVTVYVGTVWRA